MIAKGELMPSDNPFRSTENPYQSWDGTGLIYEAEVIEQGGLWRQGTLLIMDKLATLPDRCVKSNVPTERRLKRSLSWHHPSIFLAVLAGLLIYVLLALVLRKTATIWIGLSEEWFARRRRAMIISWMFVLISIAMVTGGIATIDRSSAFGWLIGGGVVLFLVGAIYGLVAARMVSPTRITDTHIWLKGVCPEFLHSLPEWPGWV